MTTVEHDTFITRRNLLKTVGLLAGTVTLASVSSAIGRVFAGVPNTFPEAVKTPVPKKQKATSTPKLPVKVTPPPTELTILSSQTLSEAVKGLSPEAQAHVLKKYDELPLRELKPWMGNVDFSGALYNERTPEFFHPELGKLFFYNNVLRALAAQNNKSVEEMIKLLDKNNGVIDVDYPVSINPARTFMSSINANTGTWDLKQGLSVNLATQPPKGMLPIYTAVAPEKNSPIINWFSVGFDDKGKMLMYMNEEFYSFIFKYAEAAPEWCNKINGVNLVGGINSVINMISFMSELRKAPDNINTGLEALFIQKLQKRIVRKDSTAIITDQELYGLYDPQGYPIFTILSYK